MVILPLFPKPVSGFTVSSFAPFFIGVFFISVSPCFSIYRLGLISNLVHIVCQTRVRPDFALRLL